MSDDAKEWVTVKIEEPVRDDAQADPRTYTEIMRDGLDRESTVRPSEEHRATELIDAVGDELATAGVDAESVADAVADRLGVREVTLEAAERRKLAEEIAGELR